MFDLITESTERPLREKSVGSKVAAVLAHAAGLSAVIAFTLSRAATVPPDVRTTLAFVAPPIEPPPLPAPPAAASSAPATPRAVSTGGQVAPIETPPKAQGEPAPQDAAAPSGVEGGVEGGITGGVAGGLVGGVVAPAPPPPLPPAATPAAPIRVGGAIKAPALVHRVEPVYSTLAASTQLSGIVVLEAVVGPDGAVDSVKVLRSPGALLDIASVDALKQWRYSPLLLKGVPTPFVITVTFNFTL
jgi:periplasmic protein TonB